MIFVFYYSSGNYHLRGDRVTVEFISVAVSAITHTSNASTTTQGQNMDGWTNYLLVVYHLLAEFWLLTMPVTV